MPWPRPAHPQRPPWCCPRAQQGGLRPKPALVSGPTEVSLPRPPPRQAHSCLAGPRMAPRGMSGTVTAFCPVSVSGSDTTLPGGGEGHVHTGPHQRPGHRRGQHPTPSHPPKCLPEEPIEMKEQPSLGTRQIGTQEAERLHRRRDPAQGS